MSTAFDAGNGKITVPDIVSRKSGTPSHSRASSSGNSQSNSEKRKIVCLTAYDYPTARLR